MKKRRFIGRWVVLDFGSGPKRAKITGIAFHQALCTPVFSLISKGGNDFYLTRRELEKYECTGHSH